MSRRVFCLGDRVCRTWGIALSAAVALRWLTAALFIAVGITHFTSEAVFAGIMPPFIPTEWHRACVWASGAAEIAGGVGLLVPQTRRVAAWGLLALLLAVFPANIHMAINDVGLGDLPPSSLANWIRLPFQFLFGAMVWRSGGLGGRGVDQA